MRAYEDYEGAMRTMRGYGHIMATYPPSLRATK